jgi:hypothetical protein
MAQPETALRSLVSQLLVWSINSGTFSMLYPVLDVPSHNINSGTFSMFYPVLDVPSHNINSGTFSMFYPFSMSYPMLDFLPSPQHNFHLFLTKSSISFCEGV